MECLTKHRAALAFKRGKNGLNVLICLFTGETAVICAQHKVERNALLPIGNAGAAVNVKERYFLEKALCTAANALFERADGHRLIADDGNVARDGGELRQRLIDRDITALFIHCFKA